MGAMQRADSPLEVNVRGFSAGSYVKNRFLRCSSSLVMVLRECLLGVSLFCLF